MQLCDTCGFVLNESDFKCANCAAPIPDREAPIEQIQARTPIEKPAQKIIIPRNWKRMYGSENIFRTGFQMQEFQKLKFPEHQKR